MGGGGPGSGAGRPARRPRRAAGHDDPERWWEDAVEHRGTEDGDALAPFTALAEAMGALRETYGDGGHPDDEVREAHMRLRIKESVRVHERTAVVCGAWHVPALAAPGHRRRGPRGPQGAAQGQGGDHLGALDTPPARPCAAATARASTRPGWYDHLFTAPDRPVTRWMTKVAGLLRDEDRPVSSAHVIEAVRLAESLAAMRGRPLAGTRRGDGRGPRGDVRRVATCRSP